MGRGFSLSPFFWEVCLYVSSPTGSVEVKVDCNVEDSGLFSNVKNAVSLKLPGVKIEQEQKEIALVVGGGPSLRDTLDSILKMQGYGAKVFALNNAAQYLAENGIRADYQIVLDARPENAEFVSPDRADCLLLASQCHPKVFETALNRKANVMVWHPIIEGIEKYLDEPNTPLIGGGTTVGLSGLCLVYALGYRKIHLFGYDSCNRESGSHAYDQPINNGQETMRVATNNRVFESSIAMAAQAIKFPELAAHLAGLGCEIELHGDGLLQHMIRSRNIEDDMKILSVVYDLGSSPPTYDFMLFLSEAEKHRKENGFDMMDVYFMPGPINGFRDDNLPPDSIEREAMLNRICIPACGFVKSVRNVHRLRSRQAIDGDVFPVEWKPDFPQNHYGVKYLKNAHRCFTASDSAKREVKKRFPYKYATITIREAEYWPERNSNKESARQLCDLLYEIGITPVIVPDTHGSTLIGYQSCVDAARDIDLRLALYEGAEVNVGVANGPMGLCMVSDAKYVVFKMIDPSGKAQASSEAFYNRHGVKVGDQFGPNGKVVWADDSPEVVTSEVYKFLRSEADRTEFESPSSNR